MSVCNALLLVLKISARTSPSIRVIRVICEICGLNFLTLITIKNMTCSQGSFPVGLKETFAKRPLLPNFCVRLKF